jgi:cytochrome P450
MPPELDLKHPANLQNPYPLFRWLRDQEPVHWSESLRGWAVSRYDDVLAILQQPIRFSADRFRRLSEEFRSYRPAVQDVVRVLQDWLVFRDPPDHTRLRRLLHNTFTPRELERMRPRIQQVVDELLDRIDERPESEFVRDFAFPLPASVIAVMLGCPAQDLDDLKRWSDQLARFIGGHQDALDNAEEARQGAHSLGAYFRALIAERKARPRDDLISLMLAAEENGEMLTPEEVVSNCILLLAAGHETTTNLLSNGLFHLVRHPDQLRRLRAQPALLPSAVDELLRYDGPVPALIKVPTEDVELHGRAIRAGEMVFPLLGAADRDERQFPEPDRLDVSRQPNRHLAFGHGIHFCLGGPLARVEGQIAFGSILRRFERIELREEQPPFMPKIFLRGLERLPLALWPAASARAARG